MREYSSVAGYERAHLLDPSPASSSSQHQPSYPTQSAPQVEVVMITYQSEEYDSSQKLGAWAAAPTDTMELRPPFDLYLEESDTTPPTNDSSRIYTDFQKVHIGLTWYSELE